MVFETGHWYLGGADLPVFVTQGMLLDGAEEYGFASVTLWEGETGPLPPGIVRDPDVNTIALARFVAPNRSFKLASEVKWVRDVTAPATGGARPDKLEVPPVLPPDAARAPLPPPKSGWLPLFTLGVFASTFVAVGAVAGHFLPRLLWRR